MRLHHLRTSDIAKAVGVHPNTVRLYEEWGFLPPIPRGPSRHRMFTQDHLDQMRLARTALRGPWPGRKIKQSALTLVRLASDSVYDPWSSLFSDPEQAAMAFTSD